VFALKRITVHITSRRHQKSATIPANFAIRSARRWCSANLRSRCRQTTQLTARCSQRSGNPGIRAKLRQQPSGSVACSGSLLSRAPAAQKPQRSKSEIGKIGRSSRHRRRLSLKLLNLRQFPAQKTIRRSVARMQLIPQNGPDYLTWPLI
jgi:hypothetical protein